MRAFGRSTLIDYDVNSMYWWTPHGLKPQGAVEPRAISITKTGKTYVVDGYGFNNKAVSEWLKTNCRSWLRLYGGIEFHHHGDAMLFYLRWS